MILARRCGLGRLLRRTVDRHFYAEHAPDETWPCDWLSGCFLMLRREAIEQVGHFDEGYGKYFEDVDMCLRMARAGWQVMYHGAASCYHLESRGQQERSFRPTPGFIFAPTSAGSAGADCTPPQMPLETPAHLD